MARRLQIRPFTISVLDRLIDAEPKNTQEAAAYPCAIGSALKTRVRRDLEWLLNTRRIALPAGRGLKELNRSVYAFGLPDFTGFNLSSPADHAKLLRRIQNP